MLYRSLRFISSKFARNIQKTHNVMKQHLDIRMKFIWGHNLTDIQYCKLIDDQLRSKDIVNAYQFIMHSYFKGIVLDINTFVKMFEALKNEDADMSFSGVLYVVYRQFFKPTILLYPYLKGLLQLQETHELIERDSNQIIQKLSRLLASQLIVSGKKKGGFSANIYNQSRQQNKPVFSAALKKVTIQGFNGKQSNYCLSPDFKSLTLKQLCQILLQKPSDSVTINEIILKKK